MQGGVALAQDGYPNSSGRFLGTSLTTEQVFTAGILGVLGAAIVNERKAGGATAPSAGGNNGLPVAGDSTKPIYEVLEGMPNQYSGVKGLIDGCDDLASALKDSGPFTFFSPSNPEVAKISSDEVSALRADKAKLCSFLQKHTVLGRYKYQDLMTAGEKKLLTLSGATVTLTQNDGKAYIEGIEVTRSDIAASNGWIHDLKGVIR